MDSSQIFGFWAVALLLTLTPGSDWAFVISAGVRGRIAIPAIAGMVTGYSLIIGAVSVGLGAIMVSNHAVMNVITGAGSLYLIYLGLKAIRGNAKPELSGAGASVSWVSQFARGAGVTSINPNGIMLLLVLLPQFSSSRVSFPPTLQLLVLGSLFLICIVVVYTALALLSKKVLDSRPTATVLVSKLSGTAMLVIGGFMLSHLHLG